MLSLLNYNSSEECPIVIFDSDPNAKSNFLINTISRFTSHLSTAWTGDYVPDVEPGSIRVQWWTTDNKFGKKDYFLREHGEARNGFEKLCDMTTDVTRVQIVGYASQNPYTLHRSADGMISGFELEQEKKKELLRSNGYKDFIPRNNEGVDKGQDLGVGQKIDQILRQEEKRVEREDEKQRKRAEIQQREIESTTDEERLRLV